MSSIIVFLVFCSFFNDVRAQTYQLTVSSEPFVFLSNPQSAVSGTWNVPVFQLPLGFNFEYFDIASDQLYSLEENLGGWFALNEDLEHLYMILPFYASLIDRGYLQGEALSPIYYKTEGPAGQRVFTIEYNEAGLYFGGVDNDNMFTDYISLQLRLYEGSGDIEFHIGPYSVSADPDFVFEGNPGPAVGLLANADNVNTGDIEEIILLTGNASNPTVETSEIDFLTWPIPMNIVYRFSKMGSSVEEPSSAARQSILFPNPTSGDLQLKGINFNEVVYPIRLLDVNGKLTRLWNSEADISAAGLAAGSYFVIVHTPDKVITDKLLVLPE